jgi:hypothetical protein
MAQRRQSTFPVKPEKPERMCEPTGAVGRLLYWRCLMPQRGNHRLTHIASGVALAS